MPSFYPDLALSRWRGMPMKKYVQYSVALFIGLLSLHTLSACVHTRAALGCSGSDSISAEQELALMCDDGSSSADSSQVEIKKPKMLYIMLGFVMAGALVLWGFDYVFDYWVDQSNRLKPNRSNHCANATTPTSMLDTTTMLPYNMTNMTAEKADFIIDAIATPKWHSKSSVPNEKADEGTTLNNPMVLDHQVMGDLLNDFSIEMINAWLAKGVHINAVSIEEGNTLLMYAVLYNSRYIAQCLIDKGGDVNIQSKDGTTSLMIAVKQADVPMVSVLIKHKADPCIIDHHGNTARSLAEAIPNKAIRSRIIALLDGAKQCAA